MYILCINGVRRTRLLYQNIDMLRVLMTLGLWELQHFPPPSANGRIILACYLFLLAVESIREDLRAGIERVLHLACFSVDMHRALTEGAQRIATAPPAATRVAIITILSAHHHQNCARRYTGLMHRTAVS